MAGENLALAELSQFRINGTVFDYTDGTVTIRRVKYDANRSANAKFSEVRGGRETLAIDCGFKLATDQAPHAGPYLIMNGADEFLDMEFFPFGVANGNKYHSVDFFTEEFSLNPNAETGGFIKGRVRGESNGAFSKPDDV